MNHQTDNQYCRKAISFKDSIHIIPGTILQTGLKTLRIANSFFLSINVTIILIREFGAVICIPNTFDFKCTHSTIKKSYCWQ